MDLWALNKETTRASCWYPDLSTLWWSFAGVEGIGVSCDHRLLQIRKCRPGRDSAFGSYKAYQSAWLFIDRRGRYIETQHWLSTDSGDDGSTACISRRAWRPKVSPLARETSGINWLTSSLCNTSIRHRTDTNVNEINWLRHNIQIKLTPASFAPVQWIEISN